MPGKRLSLTISATHANQRLDRALAALAPDLSRARVQALLEQGAITSAGQTVTDASKKVREGQTFDILIPDALPARPLGQNLPLTIVYEDEHLLVIDKAAGMTVHPAPGNPDGTLVNALIAHCGNSLSGIGGVKRPGIVHRLDKETSGLMVAAKNDAAHAHLSKQLATRTLSRRYLAIVWGTPAPTTGAIDKPIGRSPADRKKMAVTAKGRTALTHYRTLKSVGLHASLVECKLHTGRTHQIRVHMAAIGHPLVGDPAYGRKGKQKNEAFAVFPRQALHAAEIGFIHPVSGDTMTFMSALPADMATLIETAHV
jgi:23S rRNA pseudouridine1911/1915/1917 synthase